MSSSPKRRARSYPSDDRLVAGLTEAFRQRGWGERGVELVRREWNPYTSTSPTEVVTCRLDGAKTLRVLCKYGVPHDRESHGHRGDLAYEISVYRDVLEPMKLSTPAFYGTYRDPTDARVWLFLEFVDGSLQLRQAPVPSGILGASRWIGGFHAAVERVALEAQASRLLAYDPEYLRGWARRANVFAGKLHERFPWFRGCCERFEVAAAGLLEGTPTVIHGEFYPQNILVQDDIIRPVDWQSAAIGAGEIDLAALTEGDWPAEIVQACEREYRSIRWPTGPPVGFDERLDLARVYLHVRWLGDRPSRTTDAGSLWRFDRLRALDESIHRS